MIRSMTGFGRSELKTPHGFIRVEVKSTNHKFLEVSSRLPLHLGEFEDDVRRSVSRGVRRGKVNLFLSAPDPATFSSRLVLNEPLARQVHENFLRLRKIFRVQDSPAEGAAVVAEVLRFPDVLTRQSAPGVSGKFTGELHRAVSQALANLQKSRDREGKALETDFRRRIAEIEAALKKIESRLPSIAREYKSFLARRVKELAPEAVVDGERLAQEVAMYVKNSDISEEVTRMKSHVAGLRGALGEKGELGRKIDFIGQEMYREANTMGAKSSDVVVANQVIQLKSAIEKIREQAQNVE